MDAVSNWKGVDRIEVYIADHRKLGLGVRLEELLESLPESERKRILRYKFEADRIRCAAGAVMIRAEASRAFPEEKPEIAAAEHGKPYLKGHEDYAFNLSHSGDLIVLATDDIPVGVDVEEIKAKDWRIFHRYLTLEEMTMIESSSDQEEAFFKVWTIREAFAKEEGLGLAILDREFTVDYDSCSISYEGRSLGFSSAGYTSQEGGRYMISVCSSGNLEEIHCHDLSPDQWKQLLS